MELFTDTQSTANNSVSSVPSYVDASTGMSSDVKTEVDELQGRGQQPSSTLSTAVQILSVERQLSNELNRIAFSPPVAYVYNPLIYAWETHSLFVSKFGNTKKQILFVGMNPGPWGMVQTGVTDTSVLFS